MAITTLRIGAEWCDTYPQGSHPCRQPNLRYGRQVALNFLAAMRSGGHDVIFNRANDNAWSSDFDHPDFGGTSLNGADAVHFCYYSGHGGHFGFDGQRVQALAFSSNHSPPNLAPCFTMSAQWRLGANRMKWLLIDSCMTVKNTDPGHIVEVWAKPMRGVHLLLGFVDIQLVGPHTWSRRAWFGFYISGGRRLATTWIDTAYGWENPGDPVTRPIAIAAGASRNEAIARREEETLDWVHNDVAATNWLAWKWRD